MNYYISDIHFGCVNSFEDRTLEDDRRIINNWNKTVTNNDTVYILGDIGRFGGSKNTEYLCECISVLKGNKVLIQGNHDAPRDARIKQLFMEICDYKKITDNFNNMNHKVILSHYPILFFEGQHRGYIHLYGHLHNSYEETIFQECIGLANEYFNDRTLLGATDCPQTRAYNVGAMRPYMNYTPRTLKEIMEARHE